jgi:hypothetical protein
MFSGSSIMWLLSMLVALAVIAGVAWCIAWWLARSD